MIYWVFTALLYAQSLSSLAQSGILAWLWRNQRRWSFCRREHYFFQRWPHNQYLYRGHWYTGVWSFMQFLRRPSFCIIFTPPPVGGWDIVFERFLSFFLSFFVYLFLCQQHYEKTEGPICMKFSGKVWSDHGMTWLNFGSIRVNRSAGRRPSFLLSPAIAQKVIVIR